MRGPVMDSHKENMLSLLYSEKELNELKNNHVSYKTWGEFLGDVRNVIVSLGLLIKSHWETCDGCSTFIKMFYHPNSKHSIYVCLNTECEEYLQAYPKGHVIEMINEMVPGEEEE